MLRLAVVRELHRRLALAVVEAYRKFVADPAAALGYAEPDGARGGGPSGSRCWAGPSELGWEWEALHSAPPPTRIRNPFNHSLEYCQG